MDYLDIILRIATITAMFSLLVYFFITATAGIRARRRKRRFRTIKITPIIAHIPLNKIKGDTK